MKKLAILMCAVCLMAGAAVQAEENAAVKSTNEKAIETAAPKTNEGIKNPPS